MSDLKWVWQNENYPNFTYDHEKISPFLEEVYYLITFLRDNEDKFEDGFANLVNLKTYENEIISSSLIEGEKLDRSKIRSSLKTKLLINPINEDFANAEQGKNNLVELFIDSVKREPVSFSKEILFAWHEHLFSLASPLKKRQISAGRYRTDEMEIVLGAIGREKVYYVGVHKDNIEPLMDRLIDYIKHSNDDPITKSAIAHISFEIIHPFDDGNGRIGRLISNMILPKDFSSKCSISQYINLNRKGYDDELAKASTYANKCDLTDWIIWFLDAVSGAMDLRMSLIQKELDRISFLKNIDALEHSLSVTQKKVLEKIFNMRNSSFMGKLDDKKYRSLAGGKISLSQAHQELDGLINLGWLEKNNDGWKIVLPERNVSIFSKIFKNLEEKKIAVKGPDC